MKILSCGAGQQSTALALMSCENALMGNNRHPEVPIYDAILFCDLGGERKWVYEQVDFIKETCERAGISFYILRNKNLKEDYMQNYGSKRVITIPFWSIDENGKKGKMTRHCTIDYKILQMQNFVRWNLLGYRKGQRTKPEDVQAHEMHIGFTAEEQQRIFDSKHKLFVNKFPMVDMGLVRADNYAYVREYWGVVPVFSVRSILIIFSKNVKKPVKVITKLLFLLMKSLKLEFRTHGLEYQTVRYL